MDDKCRNCSNSIPKNKLYLASLRPHFCSTTCLIELAHKVAARATWNKDTKTWQHGLSLEFHCVRCSWEIGVTTYHKHNSSEEQECIERAVKKIGRH